MLDAHFDSKATIATGCESHGTTLRSPEKIPRMNRSMKDVPSSKSTARLEKIPNKLRFVDFRF